MLRLRMGKGHNQELKTFGDLFSIPPKAYQMDLQPFFAQLMGIMWLGLAIIFFITDKWVSLSRVGVVIEDLSFFSPPLFGSIILKKIRSRF